MNIIKITGDKFYLVYRGFTIIVERIAIRNGKWWKYHIDEMRSTEFDDIRSKTRCFEKGVAYVDLYYQHQEYVKNG